VRRLRAKLGPEYESLIGTVRNVGYKAVRPARGRPPVPEAELSDELAGDLPGEEEDYDAPDGVPPTLADPLRTQ